MDADATAADNGGPNAYNSLLYTLKSFPFLAKIASKRRDVNVREL